MKYPNKVTSYGQSSLARFPLVLSYLEEGDLTPDELYAKTKKKFRDIVEFQEVLDGLFALGKIQLSEQGVIHYVEND